MDTGYKNYNVGILTKLIVYLSVNNINHSYTNTSIMPIIVQQNYFILLAFLFFWVISIAISGGPLSALTCCVNARLLSAIKKISPLIYSQSWVGSWVYTTQAMMTFTLIF